MFSPISKLIGDVALMDHPAAKDEKCILDCTCSFLHEWTFVDVWLYSFVAGAGNWYHPFPFPPQTIQKQSKNMKSTTLFILILNKV